MCAHPSLTARLFQPHTFSCQRWGCSGSDSRPRVSVLAGRHPMRSSTHPELWVLLLLHAALAALLSAWHGEDAASGWDRGMVAAGWLLADPEVGVWLLCSMPSRSQVSLRSHRLPSIFYTSPDFSFLESLLVIPWLLTDAYCKQTLSLFVSHFILFWGNLCSEQAVLGVLSTWAVYIHTPAISPVTIQAMLSGQVCQEVLLPQTLTGRKLLL